MADAVKSNAAPGTTDELPRWEGPQSTRPSSYLPAADDPDRATDANGETNAAPERAKVSDAGKVKVD